MMMRKKYIPDGREKFNYESNNTPMKVDFDSKQT